MNEFWARAVENLQAAEALFELSLYNAAANRAYYAAFHAAATIIEAKGLYFQSDHKKYNPRLVVRLFAARKIFPAI